MPPSYDAIAASAGRAAGWRRAGSLGPLDGRAPGRVPRRTAPTASRAEHSRRPGSRLRRGPRARRHARSWGTTTQLALPGRWGQLPPPRWGRGLVSAPTVLDAIARWPVRGPGSQVGSQRAQDSGPDARHRAIVAAGQIHSGRPWAMTRDGSCVYGMQEVRGSNLRSSTHLVRRSAAIWIMSLSSLQLTGYRRSGTRLPSCR